MEYKIPIYGLIGSPEKKGDKKLYFSYNDFLGHLSKAKDADTINLDIDSEGGYCDVADKMIDKLLELKNQGKTITASNSGHVASAASKIFTVAEKEYRFFYPHKGCFLIHNPWQPAEGDAEGHLEIAIGLKEVEVDYINWYAERTGTDVDIIAEVMKENIPLTSEQIESLGFATIVKPTINAVAKLNLNLEKEMEKTENKVLDKVSVIEKMLAKIQKSFTPKALMVTDTDGSELDFPDITDLAELAEGVKVTIGGDGNVTKDVILADGTTVKIVDGVVTEVLPKEEEEEESEEMVALKEANAKLQTELDDLKNKFEIQEEAKAELVNQTKTLAKEVKAIKALASSYNPSENTSVDEEPEVKKTLSFCRTKSDLIK